jgi:hypothetical protein
MSRPPQRIGPTRRNHASSLVSSGELIKTNASGYTSIAAGPNLRSLINSGFGEVGEVADGGADNAPCHASNDSEIASREDLQAAKECFLLGGGAWVVSCRSDDRPRRDSDAGRYQRGAAVTGNGYGSDVGSLKEEVLAVGAG